MIKSAKRVLSLGVLALLAACTSSSSQIDVAGGQRPRPQIVVVQDFAVAPGEVQLDPGLSGTIDETLGANNGRHAPRRNSRLGAR